MNNHYRILIKGKNPSYFLSLLISMHISIYHKEESPTGLILEINEKDYQKITAIKTSYKIIVLNRYGFLKLQYLFSKYFVFLFGLIFFFIILFFLSHLIFSVEVIHSNYELRSIIYQDLKKFGIEKFNFKVSYEEKEEIVQKILKKETEKIEWLEIEEVGTKYVVHVEERKKNKEKEECSPRNIVAKKDAMILDIQAEEGEVIKKRLDYVKKGDIIISGLIYNKEDVVAKRCAIGKVFVEVWYQVNLSIPKRYHEEKVTGDKKSQLEIEFLDSTYHLFSHYKSYRKQSIAILASRILPIRFLFSTYLETDVVDKKYNLENIDSMAYELATNKLLDKLSEEDEIISKKILKKYEKDSKIEVEVFFRVKEDITDFVDISNIDITKENQQEEE